MNNECPGIGFFILSFILLLICIYWFSYHETAKSYNKLCRPDIKATAWDAIWVDLKVDTCRIGANLKTGE